MAAAPQIVSIRKENHRMPARRCHFIGAAALAAAAGFASYGQAGDLAVQRLRCEYRANPLNIDSTCPRLSWELQSTERGQRQTAYQVLAASSHAKLAADRGDLWDSGTVTSDQTTQIVYAGKPLDSQESCYWKVRVWDKDAKPSAWSEPASWSMGLLNQTDWKAQWIGGPHPEGPQPPSVYWPAVYLRKSLRTGESISVGKWLALCRKMASHFRKPDSN
jgi:alpha-L-rhamnosidase